MKKFDPKRYINYIVLIGIALVLSVLSFVDALDGLTVAFLEKAMMSAILAMSLSLVVGFLGELSLGHAGFMCVGAFLGGKIAAVLAATALGNSVFTLVISLIVGGISAAACGAIIGLPALRLKGDYLAIVTLAFGEIVRVIFMNVSPKAFGGPLGLKTPVLDRIFIVGMVFVIITYAVCRNLIKSKHGRAITAIRDNEIAARATGINVTKYKLTTFIIAAFFAGIAGVLYSYSNSRVQSGNFDFNYSIDILVMVVIGGMGSLNGSLIAAVLITYLNTQLTTILTGNLAVLQSIIYALILILIVIYNNAPALKNVREKYNFRAFVNKIKGFVSEKIFKIKPSETEIDAEDAANWDKVPSKIRMDEILSVDLVVNDGAKSAKSEDKEEK